MASEPFALDKAQLRGIIKAYEAMSDEAKIQAKQESSALADFARTKVIESARKSFNKADDRIAEGSKVKKSSKIGEITFGYIGQKFSGGGNTKQLWGGFEFGSNTYKQFPIWSGKEGRGSRGWFIYPTLREIQPEILARWTEAFGRVLKEF